MNAQQDAALAALAAEHPLWQLWIVPAYRGPATWCARRRDNVEPPLWSLNAGSVAELGEMIRQHEAEHGTTEEAGQ